MSNSSSIALWYTPSSTTQEEPAEADLHINFWHFEPKKGSTTTGLLEIGLLLHNGSRVNDIHLSFPVLLESKDVLDLGSEFKKASIARAVFNENLKASHDDGLQKCVDLTKQIDNSHFARVCWLSEDDMSSAKDLFSLEGGRTTITIPQDKLGKLSEADKKLYFRFRVQLNKSTLPAFMRVIKPNDHFLLSGYDQIEHIDFRFNRIRNLPDENMQQNVDQNAFSLRKINFFVIAPIQNDIISFHKSVAKARLLEEDLWDKYFDRRNSAGKTVIYQWKEEQEPQKQEREEGKKSDKVELLKDFSAFVKFKARRSTMATIGSYAIVAALISFMSKVWEFLFGAIGAIICRSWPSLCATFSSHLHWLKTPGG